MHARTVHHLIVIYLISGDVSTAVQPLPGDPNCPWSYDDTSNWGSICPESFCDSTKQSPINIEFDDTVLTSSEIKFGLVYFKRMRGYFQMKALTLEYAANDDDHTLTYGGTTYVLQKFLLRWGGNDTNGSEHTLNNHAYPLEMQFQHSEYI